MDFNFNREISLGYHSKTQIARVLTEDWLSRNMYCPICGNAVLRHYEANRPVADFYCESCHSDFELKSKESGRDSLGSLINDGQYDKMVECITSNQNPHFFFMQYSDFKVRNLILIPNHYFTPSIIIKRKPLSDKARRAGWVGCNINIADIPSSGKIYVIQNGVSLDKPSVIRNYQKTAFLKHVDSTIRGWMLDVLFCIERIPSVEFTLEQVYTFAPELSYKHPDNNFVHAKIRQQLQLLRDNGYIKFISRGHYCKNQTI